jgi:hypothetical protein
MPDNILRVTAVFDSSGIKAGSTASAQAVNQATSTMSADFSALEAKIKQLEAQTAQLEAQLSKTATSSAGNMGKARVAVGALTDSQGMLANSFARLAAQSSVLGPILNAAFPIFTALALLEVITSLHEKFTKLADGVRQGDKEFRDLNESIDHQIDSLQLENLKLEETYNKMAGKPATNGFLQAIVEIKLKLDELNKSLSDALQKENQLLEKHEVGFMVNMVTGAQQTGQIKEEMKKPLEDLQDAIDDQTAAYDRASLMEQSGGGKMASAIRKEADEHVAEVQKAANAQMQSLRDHLAELKKQKAEEAAGGPDYRNVPLDADSGDVKAPVGDLREYERQLHSVQRSLDAVSLKQQEFNRFAADTKKVAVEKDYQENLQLQRQAEEAQVKNAEEAFGEMKVQDDVQKADKDQQLANAKEFWTQMKNATNEGTLLYVAAQKHIVEIDKQIDQQQATEKRQLGELIKQVLTKTIKDIEEISHENVASAKATYDQEKAAAEQDIKNKTAQAAERLRIAQIAKPSPQKLGNVEKDVAKEEMDAELAGIARVIAALGQYRQAVQSSLIPLREKERILAEIALLEKKQVEKARDDWMKYGNTVKEVNKRVQQEVKEAFDKMTNIINGAFMSWINKQESLGQAMAKAWNNMASAFIQAMLKMAEQMFVNFLLHKAISDDTKLDDAKVAAANTYASVSAIPIVGWVLAPLAAAVAFAAVMAFEKGGVVPGAAGQAVPVIAHAQEMILPSHIATPLQDMIASGGLSQKSSETFHDATSPMAQSFNHVSNNIKTDSALPSFGKSPAFNAPLMLGGGNVGEMGNKVVNNLHEAAPTGGAAKAPTYNTTHQNVKISVNSQKNNMQEADILAAVRRGMRSGRLQTT